MIKIISTFSILFILSTGSLFAQNMVNGNFDDGPASGWTQFSSFSNGLIGTASFFASTSIQPAVTPRSGNYMARIGGFNSEQNYIKQTVTLPNMNPLYVRIFYQDRAFTGTECSGVYAGAEVKIIIAGQTILDQLLCYYNTVNQWTAGFFDLTSAAGNTVEIKLSADAGIGGFWSYLYLDDISFTSVLDVKEANNNFIPSEYKLEQNFPNPFNPTSNIKYSLPFESDVRIIITNIVGETIKELVKEHKHAGNYVTTFNGSGLSSGVYFYSINATSVDGKNNFISTKKMTLLK